MSLNQIHHNVPTGAAAFSSTEKPSLINNGFGNMKRSHSVKTHALRKPSWTGKRNISLTSTLNKENEILSEEDESYLG